ncbi:uncharacterized protein B0H64DRAFT_386839 [Chaetomium fimeti]|uniref:Uncharacterized protein n=1 Tax=Chaetomium fimeti TaxID=1854472 RepID=A0AAE0HML7_9PEZI|nr:hypothetical protein B0H64DRAFT_386839 [Chaetomium fimeti]
MQLGWWCIWRSRLLLQDAISSRHVTSAAAPIPLTRQCCDAGDFQAVSCRVALLLGGMTNTQTSSPPSEPP